MRGKGADGRVRVWAWALQAAVPNWAMRCVEAGREQQAHVWEIGKEGRRAEWAGVEQAVRRRKEGRGHAG